MAPSRPHGSRAQSDRRDHHPPRRSTTSPHAADEIQPVKTIVCRRLAGVSTRPPSSRPCPSPPTGTDHRTWWQTIHIALIYQLTKILTEGFNRNVKQVSIASAANAGHGQLPAQHHETHIAVPACAARSMKQGNTPRNNERLVYSSAPAAARTQKALLRFHAPVILTQERLPYAPISRESP